MSLEDRLPGTQPYAHVRTCNGNDTFPRHVTRAPLPRYIIYHFAVICIDTEYPSLSPFARTRLVASGFEVAANTRMEYTNCRVIILYQAELITR